MMRSNIRVFQQGFTLLEMVLVLFLVGLMASATLMLTEGVEDQAKYEETKRRLELIRMAIIGDTTRQSNGSTEISGFAADMGRLPLCVDELLVLGAVSEPAATPVIYKSICDEDVSVAEWGTDASTGVSYGWRGPYLQVLAERDGEMRFRDGYLNDDLSSYDFNSGWGYFTSGAIVSVSSAGFDITDSSDDIVQNQLITFSQWQVNTADLIFYNLDASTAIPDGSPSTNGDGIVLRVYRASGASYFSESEVKELSAGSPNTATFSFDASNAIPMGFRAYEVLCFDSSAVDPDDEYFVFDGDCDVGSNEDEGSPSNYVKVIPGQTLYLDWRL